MLDLFFNRQDLIFLIKIYQMDMMIWVEQGLVIVLSMDVRQLFTERVQMSKGHDLIIDPADVFTGCRYFTGEMCIRDRGRKIEDVPAHLKDSHYSGAAKLGRGLDYKYPHAYGGYVTQQYLPDDLYQEGVKYYHPTENGSEASFKKYLEELERIDERNKKG